MLENLIIQPSTCDHFCHLLIADEIHTNIQSKLNPLDRQNHKQTLTSMDFNSIDQCWSRNILCFVICREFFFQDIFVMLEILFVSKYVCPWMSYFWRLFVFVTCACAWLSYFQQLFGGYNLVAVLSTGATNLGGVKKNWNRDFGGEEDQMAEVGQGRTLSGDLDKFWNLCIFVNIFVILYFLSSSLNERRMRWLKKLIRAKTLPCHMFQLCVFFLYFCISYWFSRVCNLTKLNLWIYWQHCPYAFRFVFWIMVKENFCFVVTSLYWK